MNTAHGNRGQIPLDSKHAAAINNQALERAAAHLERTAGDFEQLSRQARDEIVRSSKGLASDRSGLLQTSREADEKARLLRGQAAHIREMKVGA